MELVVVVLSVFILICFCYISEYGTKTKTKIEELNKEIERLNKEVELRDVYKREVERIEFDKEVKSIGIEKMTISNKHQYRVIGKKKPKILIGDYNLQSVRNTCGVLMRMGFDVDVVETAEDIIERVKSFMHYDLIISNNEYYGSKHKSKITNSYQLLNKLKEIEDFNTPVIVLTVSDDREKFISYGFNEYMQKILDEEKVIEVFPKVLKKIKFETIEKQ
ncbi:MAG: response regulator [Clostridiales bacterium]|nr:response regulator [Clostridiales bacterium]